MVDTAFTRRTLLSAIAVGLTASVGGCTGLRCSGEIGSFGEHNEGNEATVGGSVEYVSENGRSFSISDGEYWASISPRSDFEHEAMQLDEGECVTGITGIVSSADDDTFVSIRDATF